MISLIIIVKNDPRIAILLERLKSITYPEKTEIIVVDASKGKLDYIKKAHPTVNWIDYKSLRIKKTYAEQRNLGIKISKGNIIVFIDADCIPKDEWLPQLVKPIYKDNERIVSGACRPLEKNFIHKEEKYGKYRDECETMNLAVLKEVFIKVGSFDERLEGCEDSDFCIRAKKKGYKIRYVDDAIIEHDWGGIKKNLVRSYNGGRDRMTLYMKHKQHLTSINTNNIYTLYYVSYILFSPLLVFYPIYVLILFVPSLVKRRNPIKEIFNLSFACGLLVQAFTGLFVNPVKK